MEDEVSPYRILCLQVRPSTLVALMPLCGIRVVFDQVEYGKVELPLVGGTPRWAIRHRDFRRVFHIVRKKNRAGGIEGNISKQTS
jgi:hypothetical protein